jgi:hypothetical protein
VSVVARDVPRQRMVAVALRSPAVWMVLPVILGLDIMGSLDRGLGWRGELGWYVESVAPVVMLMAPFLAGVGAWLARQDNALDRNGLLRSCADGRRHVAVRVIVAAAVPATLHLLTLIAFGMASLATARVGVWPIGPVLVQLAAFPAFTSLGYLVGRLVDHVIGPPLAAAIALLTAYTDYGHVRWPLGLISDGATVSLVGLHPDHEAVVGRVAWCAAVSGLAVAAAGWRFAATRRWWIRIVALLVVLVLASHALQIHQRGWVSSHPVANRCAGVDPEVCTLPDYAGLLARTTRVVDRVAALLRSTGASGLAVRYVAWEPRVAGEDWVSVVNPETAYQPADTVRIAEDAVTPYSCPQWQTGENLDSVGPARQIVLTWLVRQDPSLSGGKRVTPGGADVKGFLRLPAEQQRVRVASLATALATCRFGHLPRQGSPM